MSNGAPTGASVNGNGELHQPRARKPAQPALARALNGDFSSSPNRLRAPSERSTPAPPDDAPPSVKATSAVRRELRQKSKHRIFPTVEYAERVSYFDPRSDYANFRGFFVLFWVGLAIMVFTAMLRNLKDTGTLLNFRQWSTFTENIYELAALDMLMVSSTALALPLHLLYKSAGGHIFAWTKGGMVVQSLFQVGWLAFWLSLPFLREWTWTAQVFLTLHILTMFMKLHSYAFYNGHLSNTLQRLKELDPPIGPQTPTTAAVRYPTAHSLMQEAGQDELGEHDQDDELKNISPILQLREDLAKELTSPLGNVTYPQNLTLFNFADYLLCPTLCYELEYPRLPERSYLELFYKTLAVFGCIFLMTVTSEEFIIPVLDESQIRLQLNNNAIDGALIFAETVSRLLFPFMVTFLLVFLVIFEYTLGAFAEITRFADRQFYSDWWNSLDWLEFSREWNIPVHNFFRRHVYSASRGAQMSRPAATAVTFCVSALAHELVMGCITRKFRGYGFLLLMMQIPLVAIQRLPWVKDQQLLNNVMFWIFMIMGLSLVSRPATPLHPMRCPTPVRVTRHTNLRQRCALYVLV